MYSTCYDANLVSWRTTASIQIHIHDDVMLTKSAMRIFTTQKLANIQIRSWFSSDAERAFSK